MENLIGIAKLHLEEEQEDCEIYFSLSLYYIYINLYIFDYRSSSFERIFLSSSFFSSPFGKFMKNIRIVKYLISRRKRIVTLEKEEDYMIYLSISLSLRFDIIFMYI